MLSAIVWFCIGALTGLALAGWWLAPTRRAIGELVRLAQARRRGDWKHRITPGEHGPRVLRDVEELGRITNDVADRTLRQLKDLNRRGDDLRALVDALPDPLLLADTLRKVILINKPAAELLGVEADEALGQSVEAVVSEPAVLGLFDRVSGIDLDETNHDGKPLLPLNRQVRLSRGGVMLAYQATATRSGAGGVLVVLRDISTLDQALRMKADFVANAGHELRTPIAAIKAAYETLEEIVSENGDGLATNQEAVGRCMSILGGHLQRLEEMLRDLLDLSRVESGEQKPVWETVTIGDLARDLRQTLGKMASDKDIRLQLPNGAAAGEAFTTDSRLLMLAVKNLVENAIKYTPAGGTVELGIDRHELDGAAAAMHQRLTGRPYSELRLFVRDTGVGIAPQHLNRVFERFYQVDAARSGTNPRTSGRGTGLGLSIVKHAVMALGGSVSVQSEPGAGSTFTIALPQAMPHPTAATEPAEGEPSTVASGA